VLAAELREALQQFGIEVEIGDIQSGPAITRFEVHPAPGVRVEKIENLDKNIALTLRAPSVRILAPVPGKNCVGIEVPNAKASPVCLREILESEEWRSKTAEIPIVLGRGVTGEPLIADLARMPHLLIAGATGSGKTVCINSILASFLFHASPEDLRLILVDPKIVEMQIYNRLPHMLLPTLTDPKKVPNALRWLICNMEWRYHLFASVGVRNIAGFNAKVTRTREEMEKAKAMEKELSPEERAAMAGMRSGRREAAAVPQQKLPYIVCVIDELADLMLVAPDDIENYVTRLAQLARAAGIHLILATQRPSVNVITGVIKANLPSRIAFKVASKVDSRTILDANGADGLLGRGDMLFLPPGASALQRAQGAWVSDDEIGRVVDFLSRGVPPKFDRQAMAFVENPESGGAPEA
jgi:S-DNA-T family DNA segregation ATPase FtsK/SpoIIIE